MNCLASAVDNLEEVIREVDVAMAKARAHFTVSRLEWLDEAVENKASTHVYSAKEEVISGTLRNNRGTVRMELNDLEKNVFLHFVNLFAEIGVLPFRHSFDSWSAFKSSRTKCHDDVLNDVFGLANINILFSFIGLHDLQSFKRLEHFRKRPSSH